MVQLTLSSTTIETIPDLPPLAVPVTVPDTIEGWDLPGRPMVAGPYAMLAADDDKCRCTECDTLRVERTVAALAGRGVTIAHLAWAPTTGGCDRTYALSVLNRAAYGQWA